MKASKRKPVQLDAASLSEDVKAVLVRFVKKARANGCKDAVIEQVIRDTIIADYEQLRQILHLNHQESSTDT